MRLHRFYVTQPLGEEVVIDNVSIIKQWVKVFRYKESDLVILFNGSGEDLTYSLKNVSPTRCDLTRISLAPSYIPKRITTIYQALIKKDNFELVVQKATELGITKIVPIIANRSEKKDIRLDRLQIIATEASEQCGRGDVPTVKKLQSLAEALEELPHNSLSFVLEGSGELLKSPGIQDLLQPSPQINIFIGPEGGWTVEELHMFKVHAIKSLSLGATVLRAETAAIVGCALITQ
jgi:16S rRNA (uracil1498-N3)-methyltransferase